MHRQHEHAGRRLALADEARGLDAVQVRHVAVHDDDLGMQLQGAAHRLAAATRCADDLDVALRREEVPDAVGHRLVIVGDQDTDGHGSLLLQSYSPDTAEEAIPVS